MSIKYATKASLRLFMWLVASGWGLRAESVRVATRHQPLTTSLLFELRQEAVDAACSSVERYFRINAIPNIFEGRKKDVFQLQVSWRDRAEDRRVACFVYA